MLWGTTVLPEDHTLPADQAADNTITAGQETLPRR